MSIKIIETKNNISLRYGDFTGEREYNWIINYFNPINQKNIPIVRIPEELFYEGIKEDMTVLFEKLTKEGVE